MDLSLNTSVIFAAIVLLWMVWVGPYVLRRRRGTPQTAAATGIMPGTDAERFTMERTGHPAGMPAPTTRPTADRSAGRTVAIAQPAPFRIRRGRTALALVGALALFAVVVGGVLAAVGAASWIVPAVAAAIVVGDVFLLRRLAVRDRREKVQQAFRDAMWASSPAPIAAPAPRAADPAAPVATPTPAAATASTVPAATAPAQTTDAPTPAASPRPTPWEPVEVPKPTYLAAPRAERDATPALTLPKQPKAQATPSIRKAEAAAKAAPSSSVNVPNRPAAPAVEASDARPATGLINLDDVLQRRRA